MVLIDLQHRLMEYGGVHRLDELPHVLGSVMEIEECEAMVKNLMAEGPGLPTSDPPRELFIFIDNYDDFSEEASRVSGLDEDWALIARRYGRTGLHFISAGSPEYGGNELRRRIMAANLGVGLRNAAAVDALRVNRTPPALRGGNVELGPGRGFRVRSGQASLLQLATPYEGIDLGEVDADADDEKRRALALDAWVDRILRRHGDVGAAWQAKPVELEAAEAERQEATEPLHSPHPTLPRTRPAPASPAPVDIIPAVAPVRVSRIAQLETLLPLAAMWEMTALDGQGQVVGPMFAGLGGRAPDASLFLPCLRELYCRIQRSYRVSEETITQMMETMNDDVLISTLTSILSDEEDGGPNDEDVEPTGDSPEEQAGFVFTTFSERDRQRLAEAA